MTAAVAVALTAMQSAHVDPVDHWRPLIDAATLRCGVPHSWIERVMLAESAGLLLWKGRPIRSSKGAIGLMQLMPASWATMRDALGLGADPDDPRDNITAGACLLRILYGRFGYPGLFAAYNAGPARYAAYLAGRQTLPGETVRYLGKVASVGIEQAPAVAVRPALSSPAIVFAIRRESPQVSVARAAAPVASSLFLINDTVPSPEAQAALP